MKRFLPSVRALALIAILSGSFLQARAVEQLAEDSARVIVRFKPQADSVRAKTMHRRMPRSEVMDIAQNRANALGLRTGRALRARLSLDERTQVVTASGMDSATLAKRLAQDSEVELVAVDQRRRRTSATLPNDELYGGATPAPMSTSNGVSTRIIDQWYLKAPTTDVVSSINAPAAWSTTTGASTVVVAVLDTGVRKDHPDLAGQFVGGWDMIGFSSPGTLSTAIANDGNGSDSDASDPGDWVAQSDIGRLGSDCTSADIGDSSWHGTRVSGLIAALSDNGRGMAGVARGVKVLPIRVLGKCGGYDSDIIAGMKWAAGVDVPGLAPNPNPARVLNMSLGSNGSCSLDPSINTSASQRTSAALYREVITQVNLRGTTVVVAAGNGPSNLGGTAVGFPANCPDVISVGALRHAGSKVGFSDLGPEVTISAPGGNCVNIGSNQPCLYSMISTTNSGTQGPVPDENAYTGGIPSVGTSFSAPIVAGTVGLMLSVNPNLTPAQVKDLLTRNVRPFVKSGATAGIPECVSPSLPGKTYQDECYCTTSTCGAGMLDAGAVVRAALAAVPDTITISSSPAGATAGQTITVSAAGSTLANGRTIAATAWTLVDGGGAVTGFSGATNAMTATLLPTVAGTITVRVSFTDELGGVHTSDNFVIAVAAAPVTPVTPSGGGGGGAFSALWLALLGLACAALGTKGR